MNSIGARLTLWYAACATGTLVVLFAIGYLLLENRLTHGLDQLNLAELKQVEARMGSDYQNYSPKEISDKISQTSEYASTLFYIVVDHPHKGISFYSRNLHGNDIPDVKGKSAYNTVIPNIGPVRVDEFVMKPFDVTIATSRAAMNASMRNYVFVCLALVVGMLIVSVAVGRMLSHLILQPLRLISETAERIGSDNLSERVPVGDIRDELSELSRLLNKMFDRLESSFNQIRRFSDDVSHELRTPLSLIRLHAEKMLTQEDISANVADAVVVQIEEVDRLNRIVDELLFLSRAEAGAIPFTLTPQDPTAFLESFRQDAMVLTSHHALGLNLTHFGSAKVPFEERWIRQVLLNLLSNAIKSSPPKGLITLSSVVTETEWRVSVADEGPGVPADQCARIFERFVKLETRPDEKKGSGLGLAICRSILTLHRGRIYAELRDIGKGLQVTFEIPVT
jgi:two-component system heavy metal sensor histidine kinase CusS